MSARLLLSALCLFMISCAPPERVGRVLYVDPNGDGSTDSTEDEFLEVANVALALGGVTIIELDFPFAPRHTFPDGTTLGAGESIVVFGGGDVSELVETSVQFVTAENGDPVRRGNTVRARAQ